MRVTVKCVACGRQRDVGPGEVPAGEVPTCDRCMGPMVAVSSSTGGAWGREMPWERDRA